MKQKKFPVLAVLVVGGIGAATLLSAYFKPAVGDYATIQKMRADQERAKQENLPATSGPRTASTSTDLEKGMKDALAADAKGKGNVDRMPQNKEPLIKSGVPKTQRDVQINKAIPAGHWYRDEFRREEDEKKSPK